MSKRFLPFHYDPARAAKLARLHRLKRKGLTIPDDKPALREAAEQAATSHPITRVPAGKRTT